MSSSFARFIIAIYNNPSDPRSPSHVKRKKDKAKVGSCLARHALSGGDQQLDDALSSFYNKVTPSPTLSVVVDLVMRHDC